MNASVILSGPLIVLILLYQSTSTSAASTAAKALLQLTGAISIDIHYEIQFILQFTSQFQFLANSTANARLATPIISLTAQDYLSTTTSQTLWGLSNINSLIQSAALSSHEAYLGYYYNATNGAWYTSFKDSGACKTYAANSIGVASGALVSSTPCNPTSWNVYTNVSTVQGHSSYFFAPYLFTPMATYTENVLLPFSQALNLNGTVITANASLSFLKDLLTKFADEGVVLYVMTNSNQGYSLLATSIGESLVSNRNVLSALQAKNEMIKYSAQYWTSNTIRYTAGSSGSSGTFSANGLNYLTSASLFKSYASLNLEWIVVSVMLTGATGSSQSQLQNVTYEGLNGNSNSKVCEGIASATSILLIDFVSFGLSLNFLTGHGDNPLGTPVLSVKQTGLTSVTQQTLWGMANAYQFSSTSTFYGTYLVDQGSGGYDGYNGNYYYHRILQPAPECPSFKNTYGTTYPTIATDCMRVFPIYSNGQPYQPLAQLQYDPRNTSWYIAMQSTGNQALFYGTTTVPEGLSGTISGVVLALPVQNNQTAPGLLGTVEFFIPSTVFSQAISSIKDSSVNVSYIVDSAFYFIASSQQPTTSFVTSNGTRLSALNSTNDLISISASYLKDQSVNTANTFYVYFTSKAYLTVSLRPIATIASVSVNWKVITVSVTTNSATVEAAISSPTASPTAAPSNDYRTILIIGITFLVVGVLSLGVSGLLLWRVRSQSRPKPSSPIVDAAIRESSIVEIVNPIPQPGDKL